ncbi:hypothetical protein GE09DRAFT_282530 [Coniochaeta sp. 2T2.1]|nr:hypothetical protein GE09DRAFT_282530 [Coniochaeta sp. 2T2.1]
MATPLKSEDGGSAAATPDTGKPPPQPSLAEAYFFLNIIKYVRGKLDVDWAAVAQESGFKNAETAKVRFGQVKKKLGFNNSTPAAARVKPGAKPGAKRGAKRGANDDSDTAAPAEKKPRKTPAKPRGKKAQAAAAAAAAAAASNPDTTGAPASSPAASDTESPLAAKSKVYQKIAPMPSRLNDGSGYALSAGDVAGNGYAPYAAVNPADTTTQGYAKAEKIDAAVKPEPSSDDEDEGEDDEAERNARHKAELYKQVKNQEQQQVAQATQVYDNSNRSFGPPNNFPVVNVMAPSPFNHPVLPPQQVQAQGGTKQQRQHTPLPTSASPHRHVSASPRQHVSASPRQQMRNDAVQQAMALSHAQQGQGYGHGQTATTTATASNASLRQGQGQQGGGTTQQQQPVPVKKREVEVEEDMTLPSAFADAMDAMYGVDREGDVGGYGWPGF